MTLHCAGRCGTKLGRVVVRPDLSADFYFDPAVERWWDAARRAFVCARCRPVTGPVVAEAG